jgi:hypothetical protein
VQFPGHFRLKNQRFIAVRQLPDAVAGRATHRCGFASLLV